MNNGDRLRRGSAWEKQVQNAWESGDREQMYSIGAVSSNNCAVPRRFDATDSRIPTRDRATTIGPAIWRFASAHCARSKFTAAVLPPQMTTATRSPAAG